MLAALECTKRECAEAWSEARETECDNECEVDGERAEDLEYRTAGAFAPCAANGTDTIKQKTAIRRGRAGTLCMYETRWPLEIPLIANTGNSLGKEGCLCNQKPFPISHCDTSIGQQTLDVKPDRAHEFECVARLNYTGSQAIVKMQFSVLEIILEVNISRSGPQGGGNFG